MKNFLALVGFVFLVLLLGFGIWAWMSYSEGNLDLPGGVPTVVVIQPSAAPAGPKETLPPLPTITPSPRPVLDPPAYRTRVLIRVDQFAVALEAFVGVNAKLQAEAALRADPAWRSEVQAALDELVVAAGKIGEVGAAPAEYQALAGWLAQVGPEAQILQQEYLQGIETGDEQYFLQVGESLGRITEYLTQAKAEMTAVGWEP